MKPIPIPQYFFEERAALLDSIDKGTITKEEFILNWEAQRLEGLLMLFLQTKGHKAMKRLQRGRKRLLNVIDEKYRLKQEEEAKAKKKKKKKAKPNPAEKTTPVKPKKKMEKVENV